MNVNNIKAPKSGQNLKSNLDVGAYPARVVQVIGLGLHKKTFGEEDKGNHIKVRLTYELDEPMLNEKGEPVPDKPSWLSEDFFLSSIRSERGKSTLRFNAIDPGLKQTGGDVLKLINLPCMVTVAEYKKKDGTIGYKVGDVGAAPKRMTFAELVNPPVVFDPYEPDMEVFNSLPDWLKEEITSALDWNGSKVEEKTEGKGPTVADDEVPY